MISPLAGKRLRRVIDKTISQLVGEAAQIEDLWKTYFCVVTNYSRAREQVVQSGALVQALMASIAIPGVLPPVPHEGDLLCDGATFNNFPVDVMRAMHGVGQVIGCDLSFGQPRRIEQAQAPGSWALLRDRLRPRHKRLYRFPSLLVYLLNVTILYSTSRKAEAKRLTDLYLNPPLHRVGLLAWEKFDAIVLQGHNHGVEVLGQMSPERLHAFRPHAQPCGARPPLASATRAAAP